MRGCCCIYYDRLKALFLVDSFGSIEAAELDWGNENHIKAVEPPFDYIIGTDVVSFIIDRVVEFYLLLHWPLLCTENKFLYPVKRRET